MIRPHCTLSLLTAACLYGLLAVSCSPTVDYGYAPQTLRALGFTTAAMALCDASLPIYAPQLKRADRLAVVLGTEGDGLSPRTIAACDYTVKIPMAHGVDSLNVAAASAVAFWQLRTK